MLKPDRVQPRIAVRPASVAAALWLAACGGGGGSAGSPPPVNALAGSSYRACSSGVATTYAFANSGASTRTVAQYAAADCTGTATSSAQTSFTFAVGAAVTARDNQPATSLDLTEAGTTVYTLFRLSGGPLGLQTLLLGAPPPTSSAGRDGTSAATRHDAIAVTPSYALQ